MFKLSLHYWAASSKKEVILPKQSPCSINCQSFYFSQNRTIRSKIKHTHIHIHISTPTLLTNIHSFVFPVHTKIRFLFKLKCHFSPHLQGTCRAYQSFEVRWSLLKPGVEDKDPPSKISRQNLPSVDYHY